MNLLAVHSDMFGDDCVTFKDGHASVLLDGVTVSIHPQTRVSSTCTPVHQPPSPGRPG